MRLTHHHHCLVQIHHLLPYREYHLHLHPHHHFHPSGLHSPIEFWLGMPCESAYRIIKIQSNINEPNKCNEQRENMLLFTCVITSCKRPDNCKRD